VHNKDKYPDLWNQLEKLKKEKASIEAKTAPLKKERDALVRRYLALQAQAKELTSQINKVELPRLFHIDNQIAGLARAMGAKGTADIKKEGVG